MDYQKLLFSLEGRINRQPYWLAGLAFGISEIVLIGIAAALFGAQSVPTNVVAFIVAIIGLWIGICLMGKRYHDRGKSAWWILLVLVPIVNLWVLIEVGFLRGTQGSNQYGPDPLAA